MSPQQRVDFVPTDELTKYGITKMYSIGKLLVLVYDNHELRCKLDWKDLLKTTDKYLSPSLAKAGFPKQDNEIICTQVMDILVNSVNEQIDKAKQEEEQKQQDNRCILDEINQLHEQNPDLTHEEWQIKLNVKFDNLRDTVNNIMPEIWPGLEFELSISKVLNIEDCTLPIIGIILGRSSSSKTVIIDLMKKWPHSFYTSNFTPASFVTHTTTTDAPEALARIDMLPKIKNKLFLTPELSPLFSKRDDALAESLGIITSVADGHGYSSDSGAHGHRGYDEEVMFTWIGAAVDIPYKVFKILHTLGPRMYFFRMDFGNKSEKDLLQKAEDNQQFSKRFKAVQAALFDYLKWFEIGPNLTRENDQSLGKMKWVEKNDPDVMMYIVRLGILLSHLRCVAKTWESADTQGTGYAYTVSQPEEPSRAITILSNIARGHALLYGRNYLTRDDIPIAIHTAMSTAQIERVSIFSLLLANNGELSTYEILESLNVSDPTARRTMAEFKAIGLVTIEDSHQNEPGRPNKVMILKPEFRWMLSDDELKKKKSPHTPPIFNGNGEGKQLEIFWHVVNELQGEEAANNISEVDKLTFNGTQLEVSLVATGQFHNGEAARMIKEMVEAGKLKQVLMDTYTRVL